MDPSIGFSGFTYGESIGTLVASLPPKVKRRLMIGIHAHFSTLLFRPPPAHSPFEYPQTDRIKELFPSDPRCFNLIRYGSDQDKNLFAQLIALTSVGGANLAAVQLDMHWPDPEQIVVPNIIPSKAPVSVILGINDRALDEVGYDPRRFAKRIAAYSRVVQGFMIDSRTTDALDLKRIFAACADVAIKPGCTIMAADMPHLRRTFLNEFPRLNVEVLFPPRSTLSPRADPVRQFLAAAEEQGLW